MIKTNKRIKALRKALELNQTEFGDKIGVKQGSVASYETGARVPLEAVINSICREFNVNEQWLRTGEGTMFNEIPRESEIGKYIGQVLKSDDDFIKNYIISYMSLDEKSKKIVRDFLLSLGQHKED